MACELDTNAELTKLNTLFADAGLKARDEHAVDLVCMDQMLSVNSSTVRRKHTMEDLTETEDVNEIEELKEKIHQLE